MTVHQNIVFGLEQQGLTQQEVAQRVKESLADLKMEGMEERYPTKGGVQ